jgi:hypothetical protein
VLRATAMPEHDVRARRGPRWRARAPRRAAPPRARRPVSR